MSRRAGTRCRVKSSGRSAIEDASVTFACGTLRWPFLALETVGLVTARLILSNPRETALEPIEVRALADTGSLFLCIPEHVRLQLKLEVLETREVKLADGSYRSYPYAGPVVARFKNRTGFMGAVVLGDEVLLGVLAMQEMDLVVNPRDHAVDVNPDSPNIAQGVLKLVA